MRAFGILLGLAAILWLAGLFLREEPSGMGDESVSVAAGNGPVASSDDETVPATGRAALVPPEPGSSEVEEAEEWATLTLVFCSAFYDRASEREDEIVATNQRVPGMVATLAFVSAWTTELSPVGEPLPPPIAEAATRTSSADGIICWQKLPAGTYRWRPEDAPHSVTVVPEPDGQGGAAASGKITLEAGQDVTYIVPTHVGSMLVLETPPPSQLMRLPDGDETSATVRVFRRGVMAETGDPLLKQVGGTAVPRREDGLVEVPLPPGDYGVDVVYWTSASDVHVGRTSFELAANQRYQTRITPHATLVEASLETFVNDVVQLGLIDKEVMLEVMTSGVHDVDVWSSFRWDTGTPLRIHGLDPGAEWIVQVRMDGGSAEAPPGLVAAPSNSYSRKVTPLGDGVAEARFRLDFLGTRDVRMRVVFPDDAPAGTPVTLYLVHPLGGWCIDRLAIKPTEVEDGASPGEFVADASLPLGDWKVIGANPCSTPRSATPDFEQPGDLSYLGDFQIAAGSDPYDLRVVLDSAGSTFRRRVVATGRGSPAPTGSYVDFKIPFYGIDAGGLLMATVGDDGEIVLRLPAQLVGMLEPRNPRLRLERMDPP